jgi:hypothetical protein
MSEAGRGAAAHREDETGASADEIVGDGGVRAQSMGHDIPFSADVALPTWQLETCDV